MSEIGTGTSCYASMPPFPPFEEGELKVKDTGAVVVQEAHAVVG